MTSNQLLLCRLAELILEKQENFLLVDDLFDDEQIGDFVKSIQIDSPYQQMLHKGILTETVKDEKLNVTFTVEGYFHYILGEVIYDLSEGNDANFLMSLLNNSTLNGIKEGIEQCLIRDVIGNQLERLINFIDSGGNNLEICVRPLLYLMKSHGVESTLDKLLENPTDNDWQALLLLNKLLDNLQFQKLRKVFLDSVISYIPFSGKYNTELGLIAITEIDDEKANYFISKVDLSTEFIQHDSDLLIAFADCKFRFAEYENSIELLQKSIVLVLENQGADHPAIAALYLKLGWIWNAKGDFDMALDYYFKSLSSLQKTIGDSHIHVAAIYNNIGLARSYKGEYDKALEFLQRGLDIGLETLGSEHPNVATNFSNIGMVWDNKGEYDKALVFYQRGLDIRLKVLGSEHLLIAQSYNNIGIVWNNKGEYDKALEFYQRSLDIRQKTLGYEHPFIANTCNSIGLVLNYKGEYDKALEFSQRSLDIGLKTLGSEHPYIANSYCNIGLIWDNKGEYDKALEFYYRGLDISLKTLGSEHPNVAINYSNIGMVWENKGQYENAMEFYEKCLAIQLKTLGSEHPSVATTYNNIGSVMDNQGEYEKALEYYEKSLELELKTLDNGHTDVATTYLNIGDCFKNLQNLATAIQYYQKGFAIEIKGVYPFRIASCLEQLGDKKEALVYYIQSAAIRKNDSDVGLEDESTQESINHIQRLIKEIDVVEMEKIPEWLKEYIV
ncbi:MAG: tetratricopeptide repeat protein [Bacteroidota bacterium]|jgi:tetratricopeptide (TPR) repeat protein